MKQYGPIGRREQPCPEDDYSLEEAILDQLDELHADTMQAYIEFCDDRIDAPTNIIAALVPLLGLKRPWDSVRNRVGDELGEALNEIVWSIDKLQADFIEHEASRRRTEAEEIKQEAA